MQYFKPRGQHFFAGDCMPFFHAGSFHLFYLLDEDHHAALGGLGGHQWAHASSTDLRQWTQHEMAIAISESWEGSICTGSLLYAHGLYYAFYATRMRDRTQHLSLATSQDGIRFLKTSPNPFASPPEGYGAYDYRDPFVFRDGQSGLYHLLVTACLDPEPVHDRGGCLAHLTSPDLATWSHEPPFLLPGLPGVPECPDYFFWNSWYYLIFSHGGTAHYRLSRKPFGPWTRPRVDTFDASAAHVMKTAAFTGERRIGAAWVGTRAGDRDTGDLQFGGHVVFRELVQAADGTLNTKFPPELVPQTSDALPIHMAPLTAGALIAGSRVELLAAEGLVVVMVEAVPPECRITMVVRPSADSAEFGVYLKGAGQLHDGYALRFLPIEERVELFDCAITAVDGLDRAFTLNIVLRHDLIDVCIDQRRCIINRCPEHRGDRLFCYALNATVTLDEVTIRPVS